jgi:hypothetical protein
VDPDDVPILPVDQVFGENLIVDGWACIGTDCVDGELFGLEALKLKDTLVGIKFEDTSGAGFATRDWQLTANEGGNGAERFSIEDLTAATIPFTVFGAAPSNALVVDGFGNVGVGTATPGTDLHLRGGGAPRLRIEQDTSAGFLPQTWDLTADLVNLAFVVEDVTNNRKPFSIQATTGRVGIGTLNPQGNLHIAGGAGQDVFSGIGPNLVSGPALNFGYAGASFGRGAGFFNVRPDVAAFPPNPSLRFATDNVQRMIITNTGNVGIGTLAPTNPLQMASGARVTAGGVWTDASSRESKQEIAPLSADAARAALGQLAPVTFAYRADPAERHVGFVAEDVPALVATADRKGLSPMDIVAVLTRVVQEQQAALAALQAEMATLRQATGR